MNINMLFKRISAVYSLVCADRAVIKTLAIASIPSISFTRAYKNFVNSRGTSNEDKWSMHYEKNYLQQKV
jgi:hypothetical protein